MIRSMKVAAALAVGLGTAMPASAALIVCADQSCSGTTTNVLFDNNDSGTTITGTVNGTDVYFKNTGNLTMTTQGSGQASLRGASNGPLTGTVAISIKNSTFTSFEFNLPGIPGNAQNEASSVTFTIVDGAGNEYSIASPYPTYSLSGNGQNWFSGHTTDGDVIKSITLALGPTGAGVDALTQPRFGGIAPAAVPEPATWGMLIVGFGLIGAAMRRRAARPAVTLA